MKDEMDQGTLLARVAASEEGSGAPRFVPYLVPRSFRFRPAGGSAKRSHVPLPQLPPSPRSSSRRAWVDVGLRRLPWKRHDIAGSPKGVSSGSPQPDLVGLTGSRGAASAALFSLRPHHGGSRRCSDRGRSRSFARRVRSLPVDLVRSGRTRLAA